jgi:hypothetical protein
MPQNPYRSQTIMGNNPFLWKNVIKNLNTHGNFTPDYEFLTRKTPIGFCVTQYVADSF